MNQSNPAEMESVLAADLGRAVMASQARTRAEKELPTLTKAELAELLFEQVGLNKREAKDMVETFFQRDSRRTRAWRVGQTIRFW